MLQGYVGDGDTAAIWVLLLGQDHAGGGQEHHMGWGYMGLIANTP